MKSKNLKSLIKSKNNGIAAIIFGVIGGIICMFLLLTIFAFILAKIPFPLSIYNPISVFIAVVSGIFGGFTAAKISNHRKLFYALGTFLILFTIWYILGMFI